MSHKLMHSVTGPWLIGPSVVDEVQQFFDTRVGFGAGVDAGYGVGVEVRTITDNNPFTIGATLQAAVADSTPKLVKFAPNVTVDIAVGTTTATHANITIGSNTFLDGYQFPGTIIGGLDPANSDNVIVRYMTGTQPFAYGKQVSGPVMDASNCPRAYYDHCTMWDSGDVLFASGAYWLTPNGTGDTPGPYHFTVANCRLGPNPGPYAMMAPINAASSYTDLGEWQPNTSYGKKTTVTHLGQRWWAPGNVPAQAVFSPLGYWGAPGYQNGFNNDPRNGKCMNCAYDHNAVAAGADITKFDHFAFGTMYHNVMQGCVIRNGKGRSQTVDVVANLVAKYGVPTDQGGPEQHYGAGSDCDDDGTVNVRGNVYIPMNAGEGYLGFPDAVADANGVPRIRVLADGPANNKAISAAGTSPTNGNCLHSGNWTTGQTVENAHLTTGFDWTAYYALPAADVSGTPAAQALVTLLEDNPDTRAGNPFSRMQPDSWRTVHTGPTFPVL